MRLISFVSSCYLTSLYLNTITYDTINREFSHRQYNEELMEMKAFTEIGRSTKVDLDHRMRTTGLVRNEIFFSF